MSVTQSPIDAAKASAQAANLRYVSNRTAGIARARATNGFIYRNPDGSRVTDADTLARIRKLAIPPAYENVWICRTANGHLQAVGWDVRGRKQYRYHPRWREIRDANKYDKMLTFGRVLPAVRARVNEDLQRPGLPREKVLAAIVRLLETTLMRIGNEEYAKANKSYGLTTLRNRHIKVKGEHLTLDFRGKRGNMYHIDLHDRRLAKLVKRCQELPGQELFQYLDEDGARHPIGSDDVNEYLQAIAGVDITAKDFRTWAGTNLAALALQELENDEAIRSPKSAVTHAVEAVAKLLGNTPTICRKCYIHPAIFDLYLDGSLLAGLRRRSSSQTLTGLRPEEKTLMRLLRRKLHKARSIKPRPSRATRRAAARIVHAAPPSTLRRRAATSRAGTSTHSA